MQYDLKRKKPNWFLTQYLFIYVIFTLSVCSKTFVRKSTKLSAVVHPTVGDHGWLLVWFPPPTSWLTDQWPLWWTWQLPNTFESWSLMLGPAKPLLPGAAEVAGSKENPHCPLHVSCPGEAKGSHVCMHTPQHTCSQAVLPWYPAVSPPPHTVVDIGKSIPWCPRISLRAERASQALCL